jgi:hypothetical protein
VHPFLWVFFFQVAASFSCFLYCLYFESLNTEYRHAVPRLVCVLTLLPNRTLADMNAGSERAICAAVCHCMRTLPAARRGLLLLAWLAAVAHRSQCQVSGPRALGACTKDAVASSASRFSPSLSRAAHLTRYKKGAVVAAKHG